MTRRLRSAAVAVAVAAATVSIALAQGTKSDKPSAPAPDAKAFELPPGMTEADMKACMDAATPGPKHAFLADGAGVWSGRSTMWMAPGAKPVTSDCTSTITPMMDGRFFRCEMTGEIPDMGPFHGFGIYGFDNVSQTFQSTWLDSCGTGMAFGTGELSADGKTITWKYTYNCPIAKKPTVMRQVERRTGKDSATLEIFTIEPKTGTEFRTVEIALTRQKGSGVEKAVGSR